MLRAEQKNWGFDKLSPNALARKRRLSEESFRTVVRVRDASMGVLCLSPKHLTFRSG
jgi:hypothetical protein